MSYIRRALAVRLPLLVAAALASQGIAAAEPKDYQ